MEGELACGTDKGDRERNEQDRGYFGGFGNGELLGTTR